MTREAEWRATATSHDASNPQKLGEAWKDLTLEIFEGARPCWHLDLGLGAPKPVKESTSGDLNFARTRFNPPQQGELCPRRERKTLEGGTCSLPGPCSHFWKETIFCCLDGV